MPYILRPYQKECVEAMRRYQGDAALCVLATGLGKSVIFASFLCAEVKEDDHRCLILSHRDELVHQPIAYLEGVSVGCEIAGEHANNEAIISASVQSLCGRLEEFNPREFDVIIIDEAHHAAAPTYRKILDYFQGCRVFGFTATAHRGDGQGLNCVFQDIIFERNLRWGIENGYLCPLECRQVKLKYDLGTVKIQPDGDFAEADVAKALSGTAIGVAEIYQKYARGPTFIFASSVGEAKEITENINRQAKHRVAASIFDTTKCRKSLLSAFSDGILKVLVNFSVLSEGVDLPCTETVLIAKPVAHTNVGAYAQMVGRGVRLYPGKKSCLILDCVGISNAPICTAATLIGKEPGKAAGSAHFPAAAPVQEPIEILKDEKIPDTWIKEEKALDVLDKAEGTYPHDIAWNKLPDKSLLLELKGARLQIIPEPDEKEENVSLLRNGVLLSVMPRQQAYDFVYLLCKADYPGQKKLWDKTVRKQWANGQMTDKQFQILCKLAPGYPIDTHKMTKGTACSLIQRFQYEKERNDQNAKNCTL